MTPLNTFSSISILFTVVSRFHYSWLIKGVCISNHESSKPHLLSIEINGGFNDGAQKKNCLVVEIDDHDGSTFCSFEMQFLRQEITGPEGVTLIFKFDDGATVPVTLREAVDQAAPENSKLHYIFNNYMAKPEVKRILDLGGRARSGLLHSSYFQNKEVTVLDIMQDQGVDVVGDAHEMSKLLPNDYFDVIHCSAVFEHIIMPWKVAVEMSRVMRVGGYAIINTHQTVGMHDLPWDYYRYSDTAWHGIFNKYTGFKIIDTQMFNMMYIIPFRWKDHNSEVEKTAGFESSVVLVEKIGDAVVDWPLSASDVVQDFYPA